ncbi:hypothetical protein [Cytophaga aurantiaca]|uniref:hypothetical protein n=1 Tax=Cytophaga aurantiaca TaxID=29530 RepID=UPI00035C73BD|nr:hypothetical protein [Cytophaga aurantiaca]
MLFLQLTLSPDTPSFNQSNWITAVQKSRPDVEIMEADNHSEVYLYQQILKWVLQSSEPLVLHIHSLDPEASTGSMLRFLQDVLQKKSPVLVTLQGKHSGIEKYVRAFAEYQVVATEEEAVALANSK